MLLSRLRSAVLIFIASISLTACIGYGPQTRVFGVSTGPGYNDVQLAPNTWKISYSGPPALEDQIDDYALVRAAWLCHQNGYPWFTVNGIREQRYISDNESNEMRTSSIIISGFKSQIPGAMNSAFLLSSLTQKYNISDAALRR